MGILLIAVSFLAGLSRLICESKGDGFPTAFLQTSIVHGLVIVLSTEMLSSIQQLNWGGVCTIWALMAAVNLIRLMEIKNRLGFAFNPLSVLKFAGLKLAEASTANILAVIGLVSILSITLVTALVAAPNNYDSMTYHLPRVMHWIQNQSVAHYPTHNLRQISFPPGAGYIIAQFQILSGGDHFANLVQWLAFLGCILGISLLSRCFDRPDDQLLAAFLGASIPMAVMQASTTQTDLAASYWVICFAYFIFRTGSYSAKDLFWLASSLGLAIVTKPTAAIFSLPLAVVAVIRHAGNISALLHINKLLRAGTFALLVALPAVLLSAPYYGRNIRIFGQFLGIDNGTRVEVPGVDLWLSNILRNVALNLPWEYFWQVVTKLHVGLLMLDVNEPKSTLFRNAFKINLVQRLILPDEDFVANPIHMLLIVSAIGVVFTVFILRRKSGVNAIRPLAVCSLAGFLLYCLLIKWQIWGNRLLLPFFILNAPVGACLINCYLSRFAKTALVGLMVFVAICYSLTSIHRPLIALPQEWTHHSQSDSILSLERREMYHSSYGKEIKSAYDLLSARALNEDCRYIGLDIGEDDSEYPIWMSLKASGIQSFQINHTNVRNVSRNAVREYPEDKLCILFEQKGRYIRIRSRDASLSSRPAPQ